MIGRAIKAYPTLLKVGFADVVAYRSEFIIWVLTTNMPLVMLGIWHAVADDGPVGRFGQKEFVAYYLGTLVVRLMTSNWVMWELTMDIRQGTLAMRLLRPVHPLVAYSAEQLAAIPLRGLFCLPVFVVLVQQGTDVVPLSSPGWAALWLASMLGAFLLGFFTMVMIGMLSLWMESAMGVFELWMGLHAVFSGYLVPLELFPAWMHGVAAWMPFKYMLSFPVEVMVGLSDVESARFDLAVQWAWVTLVAALVAMMWRAGMRRFAAFGG